MKSARSRILIDTGPLVAILSREDAHHQSCVAALREMPGPLFSCWPVITEAAWLLRHSRRAIQQLLSSMNAGFLELLPLAGNEAKAIASLMKKYESIRPQLADASLVYLAAREGIETIFTLDRRDFSIYRTGRKRSFHILPEM
ncbi:MAG: PIN domain-containing protein [Candidatus Sulfotelmatobacter sp.]